MAHAAELDDYLVDNNSHDYSWRRQRGVSSNDDGGVVEDVLKRLSAVESRVADMNAQLSALAASMPALATKADIGALTTSLAVLETRIIKWMIATGITIAGMVFSIVKFVH
jgi:hypothetical protein